MDFKFNNVVIMLFKLTTWGFLIGFTKNNYENKI